MSKKKKKKKSGARQDLSWNQMSEERAADPFTSIPFHQVGGKWSR